MQRDANSNTESSPDRVTSCSGDSTKSRDLHILVLAYVYPPDAGSGTFRTLYFMNSLASRGVKVSVITAKREDFHREAIVDEALVEKIHGDIEVIRCRVSRPLAAVTNLKAGWTTRFGKEEKKDGSPGATGGDGRITSRGLSREIKDIVTGILSCPDQHVGWIPAVMKEARSLRDKGIDCIYATGGPWSCLVAGALVHKTTGIPLIVDFRDPWVSNPTFKAKPFLLKYLETMLEAFVIRQAREVIANTDELRDDFLRRYPILHPANTHTITNGYEQVFTSAVQKSGEYFTLVHAGELYLSRNPAPLLEAIQELLEESLIDKQRFRIQFIGGISVRDEKVNRLLESRELQAVVEIYPRVPHIEALKFQQKADALLLIQPDFPLQIPRKLFEYISLQKPVLAIAEACSATGNLIRQKHLGEVVENNTAAIKAVILDLFLRWQEKKLAPLNLETVTEFRNDALAGRLNGILSKTAGNPK